ncbi:hypothetical protein [Massilia sp.]|uniref:hypothetical protein n=1 Tax=Massilia sp. TaxID=1882437 RepID=UPI00352CB258
MTDTTSSSKGKKTQKSLDEEIAALEEKVKRLRQQKAEKEQKELAKNQKLIYALLRTEKLDAVAVEAWSKVLPQLRRLLKAESETDPAKADPDAPKFTKGAAGVPAGDSARKADAGSAASGPVNGVVQEESATT